MPSLNINAIFKTELTKVKLKIYTLSIVFSRLPLLLSSSFSSSLLTATNKTIKSNGGWCIKNHPLTRVKVSPLLLSQVVLLQVHPLLSSFSSSLLTATNKTK